MGGAIGQLSLTCCVREEVSRVFPQVGVRPNLDQKSTRTAVSLDLSPVSGSGPPARAGPNFDPLLLCNRAVTRF